MRVVLLTSKPPYPILDGGCKATSRLLEELLQMDVEILHLAHSTHKHPGDKSAYPKNLNEIHFFGTNTETSFFGFAKSYFKGTSYNLDRFNNEELNSFLKKELKSDDILIVDSLFAAGVIELKMNCQKTILRSHNVEFKIWEDYSKDKKTTWIKRKLFGFLSRRLKKREIALSQQFDEIWTISKEDQQSFEKLGLKQCKHIPVSLPVSTTERNYQSDEAFFLGSYTWGPNQEAIDYIRSIYSAQNLSSKLHLVGGHHTSFKSPTIVEHGFVEDLDQLLAQFGFLAAPIFSGSGVKIKILESMQAGIPVLTTELGSHGIEDKRALCIAQSKEEFEVLLKQLISDESLREKYGKAGRQYVQDFHHSRRVRELIQSSLSFRKV